MNVKSRDQRRGSTATADTSQPHVTSCTPWQAAGCSSRAGRAHRFCLSHVGGSGTGPSWDRSPSAPGLSHQCCNHTLWETKYCLHHGMGNGAPGLSPINMEGHIPPSNKALSGQSISRAGWQWGKGAKTISRHLGPTLTIPQPLKLLGIPFSPSASTAGRILAAVGLREAAPAPRTIRTCTLPNRIRSQRIPVEARPTPLTVLAHCVVQAAQALAGHRVTVAHCIRIHIPMTLAGDTGMRGAPLPKGVPEKSIITELAAFPWGRQKGGEDPGMPALPNAPLPTRPQPHLSALVGNGCRQPPRCWAPQCRASCRGRGMVCSHQNALRRGCRKTRGCSARRRDLLCCVSTGSALRGGTWG